MKFKTLSICLLVALPLVAQINNPSVIYVAGAPSGACSASPPIRVLSSTGATYTCNNGTWGAIGGGAFSALTGDATSTSTGGATTVVGLNGVALSGLASGVLYNTTTTGVPSIATAAQIVAGIGATAVANATAATTAGSATTAGTLTGALAANQVLGSLTAVAPTGQAVPSCSTSASALNWTSGTGFGCNASIAANTATTAANLSGTPALPNGTTATTQAASDNSTKLATTAYVDGKTTLTASSYTVDNSGSGNATIISKGFSLAAFQLNAGSTAYAQLAIDGSHNLNLVNSAGSNNYLSLNQSTNLATFYAGVNGTDFQRNSITSYYRVTSDFTTAANTSLQTITGLTWTLVASLAQNVNFSCRLAYSQATGTAAVAFGIQSATINPTNIFATGTQYTAAGTVNSGVLATLATTTATNILSATPGATGTNYVVNLDGMIENPSNASTNAINIMVATATSADAVTVKRGSFCRIN